MAARPPFVDAHVHLWDLERIRYPWLQPPFADDGPNGSVEPIARTYLLDDYLADAEGWDVRGIVHVDAGAEPVAALAETVWLQALADARGMPNAIVAFAALDDPSVADLLAAQASRPNVRGIRHIVNWHPDPRRTYTPRDLTRDKAWARGFALLARHALSFDLQCYPAQVAALAPLLARRPDVPVIVNHLGMPVLADPDGEAQWRAAMRTLAGIPHVAIKISGFGFIDRRWDAARVRPFVTHVLDLFGADRCMIASDLPTDALFAPPSRCLAALDELTEDLSEDERRDLFGRTADRVYRLDLSL